VVLGGGILAEAYFWTIDIMGELLTQPPWNPDGAVCKVLRPNTVNIPPNAVPFKRYFSGALGLHKYSVDPTRDAAYLQGMSYEGVACLVFLQQVPNTIPLYRYDGGTPLGGVAPDWSFWLTGPGPDGWPCNNAATVYVYPTTAPAYPDVLPFYRFRYTPPVGTPAPRPAGFQNYPVNPDGTVNPGWYIPIPPISFD